ncbi:MAG: type VI secretion system ImpA family N-terminal domain-containing protein [Vibrio sp.]
MQNTIFLDNSYYYLTDDSHEIRDLADYETVREQLNRRFNPLAGGPNWDEIYACCQRLAQGPGLDLLMTGYFTVASLKVTGLTGLANGLEMLAAYLSMQPTPSAKQCNARKDIFDWVNSRVARELKDLKPSYEELRDLYRAERYCERLHQLLEQQQPQQLIDFESLGYALFEHIDRIEARYHTLLKRQEKETQSLHDWVPRPRHYWRLAAAFLCGMVVIVAAWFGYQRISWFHQDDYAIAQPVPLLTSLEQAQRYQARVSESQLARWEDEFVPLYTSSIERHMHTSVFSHVWQAQQQMSVLNTLYPQSPLVVKLEDKLKKNQHDALAQTQHFVERFREIRTLMANVSLMAKKGRVRALQQHTQDLEDFAVSLSPIYGRVDYVQTLIKQGEMDKANKEFLVLKQRLNSLSWQMIQLRQKLKPKAQTTARIGQ